jgi:hypothetical protein
MTNQKETMESILTHGDHNEALLTWSENLAALGRALRMLNEHPDSDELLPMVVSGFGNVIEDYANMINHVCGQAYGTIGEFFRNGEHTLVSRVKERYTMLKENSNPCPANINSINEIIEEMKPVLTDAMILQELLSELEIIKKATEQKLNPKAH